MLAWLTSDLLAFKGVKVKCKLLNPFSVRAYRTCLDRYASETCLANAYKDDMFSKRVSNEYRDEKCANS